MVGAVAPADSTPVRVAKPQASALIAAQRVVPQVIRLLVALLWQEPPLVVEVAVVRVALSIHPVEAVSRAFVSIQLLLAAQSEGDTVAFRLSQAAMASAAAGKALHLRRIL